MTGKKRASLVRRTSERKPERKLVYQEDSIKTEQLQIEQKAFIFALKENPRGRFLRITEDVRGRRDSIIVPAPGLEDFRKIVDEMAKASEDTPTRSAPPAEEPLASREDVKVS